MPNKNDAVDQTSKAPEITVIPAKIINQTGPKQTPKKSETKTVINEPTPKPDFYTKTYKPNPGNKIKEKA